MSIAKRIAAKRADQPREVIEVPEWGEGDDPLRLYTTPITARDIEKVQRKYPNFLSNATMGDTARTYKSSLTNYTGTIDVLWDETDTTGQGALTIGAAVTLNLYPEGDTSGDTYYTGAAIVTGRTINSSFDGLVEMSISVQGSGALTETTV